MSGTFQVPSPVAVPVVLPPVVWIGGHPTIADSESRGTRLRRCLRCNTRDSFQVLSCEPGMVVHLIDPADVHANPALYDGVTWAEPEAIAGAHKYWAEKGFKILRKPPTRPEDTTHPRYVACPQCNEEAMGAGTLTPVHLPAAPPRSRPRGGHSN